MNKGLTEAQRVALAGLAMRGGRMVVTLELDGDSDGLRQSASALACLQKCVEAGLVRHTLIAEASGLFEITSAGWFAHCLDEAAGRAALGDARE
jgi:hypothetical protein